MFGRPREGLPAEVADHVVELFAYAKGVADQDKDEQAGARKELIKYEEELAAFFVNAAQGRLPKAAANAAVRMHVDHLLMQATRMRPRTTPV
jgi:hypothetical protein